MHVAFQQRAMKNPPKVPSLPEGGASMNLFGAEGSAKKMVTGFLKSILVGLQPVVAENKSILDIIAFNFCGPDQRKVLVWTALKPWAVKKTCTWSRLLAIYITVPILHRFSPKTETRITFCNGTLLSSGAPCVKAPFFTFLIFVRYALASAAQILSYLENGNGT